MGLVLRRKMEMVSPQASKQRRVEAGPPPRRPFRVLFPIFLLQTGSVIPVPRFRLERRCPRRRRVAVVVFVRIVCSDGDLGGTASPGKKQKSDPLKVRPIVGPTTKSIYTVKMMLISPGLSCSTPSPRPDEHSTHWVSRQTAATPLLARLKEHPQLFRHEEVDPGSLQSARPQIKDVAHGPTPNLSRPNKRKLPRGHLERRNRLNARCDASKP
jgi:hypothetical protein